MIQYILNKFFIRSKLSKILSIGFDIKQIKQIHQRIKVKRLISINFQIISFLVTKLIFLIIAYEKKSLYKNFIKIMKA